MRLQRPGSRPGRNRRWPFFVLGGLGLTYALWVLVQALLAPPAVFHGGIRFNPRAPVARGTVYHLALWETDLSIPKRPGEFREDLAGALAEFGDRYPNVRVEVTYVPEEEVLKRLQEAIAEGQPPDVVALPEPVGGWDLQIPVTAFLPPANGRESEPLYYAAAQGPWTMRGDLWGFPRWIYWEAWAGHDARLRRWKVDVDGAIRYGWTWDDLLSLSKRMRQEGARHPLALDLTHPSLYLQLATNAGAPWWESGEGLLWTAPLLTRVAEFLKELEADQAVPPRRGQQPFNRITHFVEQEGILLGPVNPALFLTLHERLGPELVLLPVPHHAQHREAAWLVPSGYAVFRQRDYRGDSHLRAAMELAYFLSRRQGLSTAQKMGFLPASPRDLHFWRDRAGLHYLARNFLLDYLTHFSRPEGETSVVRYLPPPEARRRLAEAVSALWAQPAPDLAAWAQETASALAAFRTNIEGR